MGFSFRKSIKIGKNTRINLSSKGGVGISTGVKGARVSVNKQGAKLYGGTGSLRYQKQLFSNKKKKNSDIKTYKGEDNMVIKKPSFFKKYYKEIIVVIIGVGIGSLIGGAGKVSTTTINEINMQIESNQKAIESKKEELKSLENKKIELEASLNS